MLEAKFCNYNKDYMQRLGFLKVLCVIGEGVRGGKQEILNRLRSLYPEFQRPLSFGSKPQKFEPEELLKEDIIPSWQSGFVVKTIGNLIFWGEMVGLITPNQRLSEWARVLILVGNKVKSNKWREDNPFILMPEEKAFFIQLLFFHDQILPYFVLLLSSQKPYTSITTKKACLLATQALGQFYDDLSSYSAQEIRTRLKVRDILERIGQQYKLPEPRSLIPTKSRKQIFDELNYNPPKVRNHLAEYHSICRMEHLTDLGLLLKEDPRNPTANEVERNKIRREWKWLVTPHLLEASNILKQKYTNIESFLSNEWINFCSKALNLSLTKLNFRQDRKDILELLDLVLPKTRRMIGPVQVHSWAMLACLEALKKGKRLEISDVFNMLDDLQERAPDHKYLRIGGRKSFLCRTASVPKDGLKSFL